MDWRFGGGRLVVMFWKKASSPPSAAACVGSITIAGTNPELVARDKLNLDIFWLKNESVEDVENLPPERSAEAFHKSAACLLRRDDWSMLQVARRIGSAPCVLSCRVMNQNWEDTANDTDSHSSGVLAQTARVAAARKILGVMDRIPAR